MPESEIKSKARWSEDRIVVPLGIELKAQLRALADALGKSQAELAKEAVEAYVKRKGDVRLRAVSEMASKLGLSAEDVQKLAAEFKGTK